MKKNLILVVGLVLVLLMVVSVSALPSWLTGKATGTDSANIQVNKGETKTFNLGGEEHEISVLFMDGDSVVVLSVDGANTGGLNRGSTYEFGNLKVKVLTIRYSNNWFSKSKYVTLEVSKAKNELECIDVCSINEGEIGILKGHKVSINWIDDNEVVFMVDGERVPASGKLVTGDSYTLSGGDNLYVDDISKLNLEGELGMARFTIIPPTTPRTKLTMDNVKSFLSWCVREGVVVDRNNWKNKSLTVNNTWIDNLPTGDSLCESRGGDAWPLKCMTAISTPYDMFKGDTSVVHVFESCSDSMKDLEGYFGPTSVYRIDAMCCPNNVQVFV